MRSKSIQKPIFAALFAALVFCASLIAVPTGLGGNVNPGDGVLLVAAWLLGGPWGVLAGAVGASLFDLTGGYFVYAPGTLVIKALMALVAILVRRLTKKMPAFPSLLLSGLYAELIMVAGYFLYESAFLGLGLGAVAGIPFNLIQAAVSIPLSILLYQLASKVFPLK